MIKKILILAAAVLVVLALIKYIPEMIGEKKQEQSERLMEMEDHAQKQADDMVGNDDDDMIGKDSDGANNRFGGEYNRKARSNANKAARRSMDRIREMEENE